MANQAAKGGFRPGRIVPPLLLVLSFFLVSLSTGSLKGLPKRIGMTVSGGFQKGFAAIGQAVSGSVSYIGGLKDLNEQYTELARKVERYANLEREYANLRAENDRMREQLGYSKGGTSRLIPARIVAKDPGNMNSGFVIDQGSADGVRKNMPVVAFQNGIEGIVGKVAETGEGSAIVLPLYDSRLFVSARLARTRYEGLASGQGGLQKPLILKYVSKLAAAEVQFGDMVVTSGLDSIYPPDISIGRVREVVLPEFQSSADILLDPALDLGKLEFLFILDASSDAAAVDTAAAAAAASTTAAAATQAPGSTKEVAE
ncbi:MAG: rod shape-determining protein MreC [Rectinemataceae bacterium]